MWDLDACFDKPDTCCNTKPVCNRHHVSFQNSHHFPGREHESCSRYRLIKIRCYIVPVNTMANGNYEQILNNFMGGLPSPPGSMASMTDLTLAALQHICGIALHLARSFIPTFVDVPFMQLHRKPVKRNVFCYINELFCNVYFCMFV